MVHVVGLIQIYLAQRVIPLARITIHAHSTKQPYRARTPTRCIEGDHKEIVRKQEMDNRWAIPYNPYLLNYFNCHINVEACGSIKAVKYLFKYIYMGHNMACTTVGDATVGDNNGGVDEIK
jgi:hypothetical protein